MHRRLAVAFGLLALPVLPAVARAQVPGYQGPDARQIRAEYRAEMIWQMNAVVDAWAKAWGRDDLDALADLYVEEAVIFDADGRAARGRGDVRAWLGDRLPAWNAAEAYLQDFEASGGMAMAHSSYRIEVDRATRATGEITGDMVTVFLLRGGDWRIRSQVFLEH
ncbi:MAG: nuclear transport factor 2 family protein [Gemmatimonadota bacterium]|jgi:ketosteroid isomerase-like protein